MDTLGWLSRGRPVTVLSRTAVLTAVSGRFPLFAGRSYALVAQSPCTDLRDRPAREKDFTGFSVTCIRNRIQQLSPADLPLPKNYAE